MLAVDVFAVDVDDNGVESLVTCERATTKVINQFFDEPDIHLHGEKWLGAAYII